MGGGEFQGLEEGGAGWGGGIWKKRGEFVTGNNNIQTGREGKSE